MTVTPVAQRGFAKQSRAADPTVSGGTGGLVRDQIFDSSGRVVATKTTGDTKWACTSYDSRGRATVSTVPALNGQAERTVTNTFAVGGDPFLNATTDVAGTIRTRVDLLGRVTDTRDVWGVVTHTDYDVANRPTQSTVFINTGAVWSRTSPTYATTGGGTNGVVTQRWSNAAATVSGYDFTLNKMTTPMPVPASWTTLSTLTYDTWGRNTTVVYDNGVTTTFGFDTWQRPNSVTHTKAGATLFSDTVVRSVAGRIIDRTVNGVDPNTGGSNYTYDGAGRLTAWSERDVAGAQNVSGTYSFAYAGGTLPASCSGISGVNVLAGLNSNRTTQTVTQGGSTTTTTFCYDFADRLRKVDMSAGTNPYTAGFVFDAHGNVTTSGNQTLVFDGGNRHVSSTAAGTTVAYVRDASNRIVSRAVNGIVQERYVFTGAGDNSSIVMSTSNVVKEFVLSLAGGVSYTWRPSSAGVWSLPNTHGDIVATTNTTGVLQGGIASFDPFGNPLGTTGVKDNSDGNLDYSWHGTAQRGLDHETGMQPTINMGARPYQPGLGRFLGTDPVEGGTPNDYLYVADPIGDSDLTGLGGGGGISQARSRGSKAKKKLQDACSHGDNDSCRELEERKTFDCPAGVKGASQFLGYRFVFSSFDQLRQFHYSNAGSALIGGYGTAVTFGGAKAGTAVAAPVGKHAGGAVGVFKVFRTGGKILVKIGSTPVGVAATFVDYACR